jgi:hypothetical protein
MKRALVDGAVAKEAKCNPIFTSVFGGKGHPGSERHVRADNGVTAIHVVLAVKKVHRTAKTARATGLFAKEFSHAGVGTGSFYQSVSVVAIRGDEIIIRPCACERNDYDLFLDVIKIPKTAYLLRLILLAGAFFKAPDQQHQREHLDFVALPRLH